MNSEVPSVKTKAKYAAIATLSGILCEIILLFLFSFAFSRANISPAAVVPLTVVSLCISCFVAGFLCGRMTRKNGLIVGIICGFSVFLLFSLVGLLSIGGAIGVLALTKLVLALIFGAIGGILGVNKLTGSRKKRGRK